MNILLKIQTELKIPKAKFNKFGGFSYRNFEDILEAVKPLLAKYDALLTMTDDVIVFGEKLFVRATATLMLADGTKYVARGFARIDETRKGMDAAQITGSASSYARKYALGALFLIDNEQDPDETKPPQPQTPAAPPPPPPAPGTIAFPSAAPGYPAAMPGIRPLPPPPPPPANR